MRYRNKLIILAMVIGLLSLMEFTLPYHPQRILIYDKFIFRPYQSLRMILFGKIPFSVGDVLYVAAGFLLLTVLLRWIYFLVKFKTHKHYLGASLIHTMTTLGVVYIFFIIGWGANYYKPSLAQYWNLDIDTARVDDTATIAAFDTYLVDKLNDCAMHYHPIPFKEVNERSQQYYRQYTDSRTKLRGLQAKASLFGYMLENFGIQGYYNPFTGEAQVNKYLPQFMLPFVVCHEMAHQSGIAAEGDANLLSYALGTATNDTFFNYSCYFNIWLYAHNRLYRLNPKLAKASWARLNSLTKAHIDTLEQIRRRYKSDMSKYSSELYDEYLRLHDQKEGIRSYGNVALSAWAWEQKRKNMKGQLINIP